MKDFKHLQRIRAARYPLSAYDSCRLISLNLKHLVRNPFSDKAVFDFNKLKEIASVGMRLSDDLVELELEKLESIKEACDTESETRIVEQSTYTAPVREWSPYRPRHSWFS